MEFITGIQKREEAELSYFKDDMILCIENPNIFTQKNY